MKNPGVAENIRLDDQHSCNLRRLNFMHYIRITEYSREILAIVVSHAAAKGPPVVSASIKLPREGNLSGQATSVPAVFNRLNRRQVQQRVVRAVSTGNPRPMT